MAPPGQVDPFPSKPGILKQKGQSLSKGTSDLVLPPPGPLFEISKGKQLAEEGVGEVLLWVITMAWLEL